MLPTNSESVIAFARATKIMRKAVLGLVDALPVHPAVPDSASVAMADLAVEQTIVETHPGWGPEPATDVRMLGSIQVYAAAESAGALAELFGCDRAFVISPYVIARVGAEAAGRATWLFDTKPPVLARFARAQNIKLLDYHHRRQFVEDKTTKADLTKRSAAIRDAARAHGLGVYKRRDIVYIDPPPLTDSQFVREGFAGAYARQLGQLVSAATHVSLTAVLNHLGEHQEGGSVSGAGFATHALRSDSYMSNMLLMVSGLALKDAGEAQFAYVGNRPDEWVPAVDRFLEAGNRFARNRKPDPGRRPR